MLPNPEREILNYNNELFNYRYQDVVTVQRFVPWQKLMKRSMDIFISSIGLLLLVPLFIYIAIKIKLDSSGPVFYSQIRMGLNGIPFTIYKFRSMFEYSEINGPALSCANDKRITRWGNTLRKWKLDELPQFFNILIGNMSLVGPRPERKFYIDKVLESHPHFKCIHQVKPGLTSLGMLKFGYAVDLKQIIRRMQYDIDYLENYSFVLDVQIICHTIYSIVITK